MGKFSRDKGRRFEQRIARILRERYPDVAGTIRRTMQFRGGLQEGADVAFPGLWFELQDAARPTPRAKLIQALRDSPPEATPVAVTHKTGSRTVLVTLRLCDLRELTACDQHIPVTMDWDMFLVILDEAKERLCDGI